MGSRWTTNCYAFLWFIIMTVKELKEFLENIPDDVEVILYRTCKEKPIFKYIKTRILTGTTEEVQIN